MSAAAAVTGGGEVGQILARRGNGRRHSSARGASAGGGVGVRRRQQRRLAAAPRLEVETQVQGRVVPLFAVALVDELAGVLSGPTPENVGDLPACLAGGQLCQNRLAPV